MFPKNLQLFRIPQPQGLGDLLENKLADRQIRKPGALEMSTRGWSPVDGKLSPNLVREAKGAYLIQMEVKERQLPAAILNEEVTERVDIIEQAEGRRLRRTEVDAIRDQVVTELLPQTLIKTTRTRAIVDPETGWLIVDATSHSKAEQLTSLLRDTLGSLPLVLPKLAKDPCELLTNWFANGCDLPDFEVGTDCVLKDPAQDKGGIRISLYALTKEEIQAHRDAGRHVESLEFTWNERISFILTADLEIKRVKFLDLVQDAREEVDAEDELSRLDADFHIGLHELRQFMPRVFDALGGLVGVE